MDSKADGEKRHCLAGGVTVALDVGALIDGSSQAGLGRESPMIDGFLAFGVGLRTLFVWSESRVLQPLLPLYVVLDRVRGGAFLVQSTTSSVPIGAAPSPVFHLQIILGFAQLETGLVSLPLTLAVTAVTAVTAVALVRPRRHEADALRGLRPLMIGGPTTVFARC